MNKKKYSVTVYYLLPVEQKVEGTILVKWVHRWKREYKLYFITKKEALKYASGCAMHYVKVTIRREVK